MTTESTCNAWCFGGSQRLFWQPGSCITQVLGGIASISWMEWCSAANSTPLALLRLRYHSSNHSHLTSLLTQRPYWVIETRGRTGYGHGTLWLLLPHSASSLNQIEYIQQKSFSTEEASFYLFPSVFSEGHILFDSELALLSCQNLLKMENFYLWELLLRRKW